MSVSGDSLRKTEIRAVSDSFEVSESFAGIAA